MTSSSKIQSDIPGIIAPTVVDIWHPYSWLDIDLYNEEILLLYSKLTSLQCKLTSLYNVNLHLYNVNLHLYNVNLHHYNVNRNISNVNRHLCTDHFYWIVILMTFRFWAPTISKHAWAGQWGTGQGPQVVQDGDPVPPLLGVVDERTDIGRLTAVGYTRTQNHSEVTCK